MSLRIATNLAALNAHRQLLYQDDQLSQSLQRLSSGLRINSAADDAAGLAISTKMESQINGLSQAQRNVQDGISLLQTAEGALSTSQSVLQRMRQLAVQAANDTLTASDRSNISLEINQLSSEVDRIANDTEFNDQKLLDGSLSANGLTFQVGASAGQTVNITLATATTSGLMHYSGPGGSLVNGVPVVQSPISANLEVDSAASASSTISQLDEMINAVSLQRANLGASINRLQDTTANLSLQEENTSAAHSRIMDVDMASEVLKLSKAQILRQSATAMLSQANQSNQAITSLLNFR